MPTLSSLYRTKYLGPLLAAVVVLYIYSLWGRVPDIDDAWLGEYAYWFEKLGFVRSELFRGFTGQEDRFIVHHKLLTLHGALFIKIFGFSVYPLKAVSLVYFLFFIWLFYAYTCRWKKIFNREDLLFSLIILFSFTMVFKYSFLFRPEIMVMSLGFAGYILMEKYLEEAIPKTWLIFVSGLLFGLTLFAHLNSLVLLVSAGILLLWNKKYGGFFYFGVGVLITSSLYFYDFTEKGSVDLWIYQFFSSPAIDSLKEIPFLLKPLMNLLKEHMRYFHNLEIIVFSVFMIVTIFVGFRYLYKKQTNMVRFELLIAIMTALIAMHKSRQYILPAFPYQLILITLTFKAIKDKKLTEIPFLKKVNLSILSSALIFLFAVFFVVSNYYNVLLSKPKFSASDNHILLEKYADGQTEKMNIIAPLTVIFNEIENFNRIHGELFYTEMKKSDPTIYGDGFLEKANEYEIDLVMVSPFYRNLLGISDFKIGEKHRNYVVIDQNSELIVLKRSEE